MILILLLLLVVISIIDIRTKIISDGFTVTGILIALLMGVFAHHFFSSLVGALVGVLSIRLLNDLRLQRLGGGDAKLVGMIGAFMGWKIALLTAVFSSLAFIPARFIRVKGIAYAPFITIGFVLAVIYGT